MVNQCLKYIFLALVYSISINIISESIHADQNVKNKPLIDHAYLAVGYTAPKLLGEFDGESLIIYQHNATMKTALLPSSGMGGGYELILGWRYRKVAWEIFYSSSNYSGNWLEYSIDMSVKKGGTNVLIYTSPLQQIQPFLLLGGYYQSVNVKDGSEWYQWEYSWLEDDYYWRFLRSGDASFGGLGGAVGPGMEVYLSPLFSLRCSIIYYIAFFSTVKMAGDQSGSKIGERMSANGYSLNMQLRINL